MRQNLLGKIDNLQKGREIGRCVGGYNAWAPIWRLGSGKIRRRKYLTEYGRVE